MAVRRYRDLLLELASYSSLRRSSRCSRSSPAGTRTSTRAESGYDVTQHREYADFWSTTARFPARRSAASTTRRPASTRSPEWRHSSASTCTRATRTSSDRCSTGSCCSRVPGCCGCSRTSCSRSDLGAGRRARLFLLPAGCAARRGDVPSRAPVDAAHRGRVAARGAHARPSGLPLAARRRDRRCARPGSARARVFALDLRRRRARMYRRSGLAAARARGHRGGRGRLALVHPAGDQVRRSGLRQAHAP